MKIKLRIVLLVMLPCVFAKYEHMVTDDDAIIQQGKDEFAETTVEATTMDVSTKSTPHSGQASTEVPSDQVMASPENDSTKEESNVFLRGTLATLPRDDRHRYRNVPPKPRLSNGVQEIDTEMKPVSNNPNVFLHGTPANVVEDDRGREHVVPPSPAYRDSVFNFGGTDSADDLPTTPKWRHQGNRPKHKWVNVWTYGMDAKKGMKSAKKKSHKFHKNKSRKRWHKESKKHKSAKKKSKSTVYYPWWAKGRPQPKRRKKRMKWWGKGKQFVKGKGKGNFKGNFKGKGKGAIPTTKPTTSPTIAPTISIQPSVAPTTTTASPTITVAPTTSPTPPALVYISVTGEDRTIQVQGNGGAEGAANPRLKVDRVGSEQDQVVIQFTDLDNIPAGSTIVSAYLSVETTTVTQRTINWHRLLVPWEESTVNGRYFGSGIPPINTEILVQPDDFEAVSNPSISFVGSADVTIDLTEDVQFWIDNPGTNFGWAVIADANDPETFDEWGFWGLDSTNNKPTLVISYIPP